MMKWTKMLCVAAAVSVSAMGVQIAVAQETTGTEARADRGPRGERGDRGPRGGGLIGTALQLEGITDEQKTKLETIQKENQEEMRPMRPDGVTTGTVDREAMREKRVKMMEAHRAKVEAVLTEEQKAALREKAAALRGPGEGRRDGEGRRGEGRRGEGRRGEGRRGAPDSQN